MAVNRTEITESEAFKKMTRHKHGLDTFVHFAETVAYAITDFVQMTERIPHFRFYFIVQRR